MADPLSIAGLAAGLISLGIQVMGGVTQYLDAIEARSEEISQARRQAIGMENLLKAVDSLVGKLERHHPASATTVETFLKPCEIEINALDELLLEISESPTSSSSLRLKIKEQKKKLTYPFKRDNVARLENRLANVNGTLQTALHVAGLDVSIATGERLSKLYDTMTSLTLIHAGNSQSISKEAVLQLVSKPSYLKSSVEQQRVEMSSDVIFAPVCSCRARRSASRRQKAWSSLVVYDENNVTEHHFPGCRFSQFAPKSQKRTLGLQFAGLRRLLNAAIDLSFSMSHGAGGLSISPSFTYYPTVNRKTAPAFRILRLTRRAFRSELPQTARSKFFEVCLDRILILYRNGKASPRDIDEYGSSLLEYILDVMLNQHIYHRIQGIEDLTRQVVVGVNKLVASGVPATTYNRNGETPLGYLTQRSDDFPSNFAVNFAQAVVDPEVPLFLSSDFRFFLLPYNCVHLLRMVPGLAEGKHMHRAFIVFDVELIQIKNQAAGSGPLSIAALMGDEAAVVNLLTNHPSSVNEVNLLQQTPLHLAVQNPSCLRLISEKSSPCILNSADKSGHTPLCYACGLECIQSIKILLDSECDIYLKTLARSFWVLLPYLKQRRDKLKAFALEHLPEAEASSLGLCDDRTLDANAAKVQRTLSAKGFAIPRGLRTYHEISFDTVDTRSSVFQMTSLDPEYLDYIWELNFRDIDAYESGVLAPPLLADCPRNPRKVDKFHARCVWLIEHGANLWMNFCGTTCAHFLFAAIGNWWDDRTFPHWYCDYDTTLIQCLTSSLLISNAFDSCSCTCSHMGCSPLVSFLRFMYHDQVDYNGDVVQDTTPPHTLSHTIFKFITEVKPVFTEAHYMEILRFLTHHALGIRHTCCTLIFDCEYPQRYHKFTSEDAEDINSEQSSLLELLDDLIAEFEQVFNEDQLGVPLGMCDPDEFWNKRWADRMTEVLEEFDGNDLSAEEISAAEDVGVVWGPVVAEEEEDTEMTAVAKKNVTLEDWMEDLEKIMAES